MIYPIIAPFQFLLGSLPGKSDMIGDWFKRMYEAVGSFVFVYAAFCITIIIVGSEAIEPFNWFPPLTGFTANMENIRHILGYALFISTPQIPGIIEALTKAPPSQLFRNFGADTQKAVSRVPFIGDIAKSVS